MGRCYHLSKTVTEDLANEIIKELTKRGDVKLARISADGRYLYPTLTKVFVITFL